MAGAGLAWRRDARPGRPGRPGWPPHRAGRQDTRPQVGACLGTTPWRAMNHRAARQDARDKAARRSWRLIVSGRLCGRH